MVFAGHIICVRPLIVWYHQCQIKSYLIFLTQRSKLYEETTSIAFYVKLQALGVTLVSSSRCDCGFCLNTIWIFKGLWVGSWRNKIKLCKIELKSSIYIKISIHSTIYNYPSVTLEELNSKNVKVGPPSSIVFKWKGVLCQMRHLLFFVLTRYSVFLDIVAFDIHCITVYTSIFKSLSHNCMK